jgi:hypothetical protein
MRIGHGKSREPMDTPSRHSGNRPANSPRVFAILINIFSINAQSLAGSSRNPVGDLGPEKFGGAFFLKVIHLLFIQEFYTVTC